MATTYKMIPIGQLHGFFDENLSRAGVGPEDWFDPTNRQRDKEALASSLADSGWLSSLAVHVMEIETDEDRALAEEQRETRQRTLESSVDAYKIMVGTSRKTVDPRTAVLPLYEAQCKAAPKYRIVDNFRKNYLLPIANAARVAAGLEPITHVPCKVLPKDTSPHERAQICGLENEIQGRGAKRIDNVDRLRLATAIVIGNPLKGSIETLLRNGGMKRGAQQKFGAILGLHAAFPEFNLLGRLMAEPTKIDPCDHGEMSPVLSLATKGTVKLNPKDKAIQWQPEMDNGVFETAIEAAKAKFDTWWKGLGQGGTVKTKATSGKDLQDRAERCPVQLVKDLLKAAATDTLSTVMPDIDQHALRLDTAIKAVFSGTGPIVESIDFVIAENLEAAMELEGESVD